MQQGETAFKKKVLKDLAGLPYTYALKTQERGRRGVPDLLICKSGKMVAIELKIDGEEPTPLQEFTLNKIRQAGGVAFSTTPKLWPGHLAILKSL